MTDTPTIRTVGEYNNTLERAFAENAVSLMKDDSNLMNQQNLHNRITYNPSPHTVDREMELQDLPVLESRIAQAKAKVETGQELLHEGNEKRQMMRWAAAHAGMDFETFQKQPLQALLEPLEKIVNEQVQVINDHQKNADDPEKAEHRPNFIRYIEERKERITLLQGMVGEVSAQVSANRAQEQKEREPLPTVNDGEIDPKILHNFQKEPRVTPISFEDGTPPGIQMNVDGRPITAAALPPEKGITLA